MILDRLFGRRPETLLGEIPPGVAVYAIGDVHGRFDLLQDLLARIVDDADRHADVRRNLIFLGDYIDRGPESRSVVEALLQDPLPGFATIRLMGNHEEAFLAFLDGKTDGLDWLAYGGLETLMSYGVSLRHLPRTEDAVGTLRRSVAASVPASHIELLRRCALYQCVGDYLFVHAGVRPGVPLEQQTPADLLWIRDDFLRSKVPLPEHVVVHGHTICDFPQDRRHRINIDTGAFASGRLTCLVLRGAGRRFISTTDR
jgi:serine/threonine protein phosphatase 1